MAMAPGVQICRGSQMAPAHFLGPTVLVLACTSFPEARAIVVIVVIIAGAFAAKRWHSCALHHRRADLAGQLLSEMLILHLHTFYRMFYSPNDSSTCRSHHIFLFAQRRTQRFQTEVTHNGSGNVRRDIFHPFSYVSIGKGVGSPLGKHAWGCLLPPCKSSDWSANQAVSNLVDILMD